MSKGLNANDWEPKHNTSAHAKANLRKWIVRELGVENPKILDVYCGPGTMWNMAYAKTGNYLGLDGMQFDDERRTIVCDNTRFLRDPGLDIDSFDVFDLDAYGLPYYPLAIICNRIRWRDKSVVAVILTDGGGFNAKMNSLPNGFLNYLGMARHRGGNIHHENRESVIRMAIERTCEDAKAKPESILLAKKDSGSGMRYIAYLMRRLETP